MAGELDSLKQKVKLLPNTPAGNLLREQLLAKISQAEIELRENIAVNPPISAAKATPRRQSEFRDDGIHHSSSHGLHGPSTNFDSDGSSSNKGS